MLKYSCFLIVKNVFLFITVRRVDRANDVDIDLPSTVANKILADGQPWTDDIKNFLLGTSEYAKDIQSAIDLHVTRVLRVFDIS